MMENEKKEINLVNKDEFIFSLIQDIEEMFYMEPKTDLEHHHNTAIGKVIENIETFYDNNPADDIILELPDNKEAKG